MWGNNFELKVWVVLLFAFAKVIRLSGYSLIHTTNKYLMIIHSVPFAVHNFRPLIHVDHIRNSADADRSLAHHSA